MGLVTELSRSLFWLQQFSVRQTKLFMNQAMADRTKNIVRLKLLDDTLTADPCQFPDLVIRFALGMAMQIQPNGVSLISTPLATLLDFVLIN